MPDFRVFVESSPVGDMLQVGESEAHHLVTVCRAKPDDTVRAFDGAGKEWEGSLVEVGKRKASIRIKQTYTIPPPSCKICLAQALPKGKTMDSLVRRLTEIGIWEIQPLDTRYSEVHLDKDRRESKTEKWNVDALEACKQSGNPWLPKILPVKSMLPWLAENPKQNELRVIASLQDGSRFASEIINDCLGGCMPQYITLLIGPEGDFSDEEYEVAAKVGFQSLRLARHVLRVETAALYAVSVFDQEMQWRSGKVNS